MAMISTPVKMSMRVQQIKKKEQSIYIAMMPAMVRMSFEVEQIMLVIKLTMIKMS